MKTLMQIALVGLFILLGYSANAQPGGPPPPPASDNAPFGFVELLVAGGALLGGKKLYDRSKKS